LKVVGDETLVNSFVEYIQFFRSELHKNRFYETYVQQATSACKASVKRLKVQLDAIDAVVGNMQDIFAASARSHSNLQAIFSQQQETHRTLLESFESNLESLKNIPLHPSLLQSYERWKQLQLQYYVQQQQQLSNPSVNNLSASWVTPTPYTVPLTTEPIFPTLKTLHNCIPEDRERLYYQHCVENHRTLSAKFTIVQANLSNVKYAVENLHKCPIDAATVAHWTSMLENEESNYVRGLQQLRSSYQLVYEALTTKIPQNSQELHRLLLICNDRKLEYESGGKSTGSPTASNSNSTSSQLEQGMISLGQRLQQFQVTLDSAHDQICMSLYTIVRQINRIHSDIQEKLKRDIEWMKTLTQGQNEYTVHLKNLASLPQTYSNLMKELVRRKRAFKILHQRLAPAKQIVQEFRANETSQREQFMKECGMNLPPVFLKLIPSLKDKPPTIAWNALEEESWLVLEDEPGVDELPEESDAAAASARATKEREENEARQKQLLLQQRDQQEQEIATLTARVHTLADENSHLQRVWKEENARRVQEESQAEKEKQALHEQIAELQARLQQLESAGPAPGTPLGNSRSIMNATGADDAVEKTAEDAGLSSAAAAPAPQSTALEHNIAPNVSSSSLESPTTHAPSSELEPSSLPSSLPPVQENNGDKPQGKEESVEYQLQCAYQDVFAYFESCMTIERPLHALLQEDTELKTLLASCQAGLSANASGDAAETVIGLSDMTILQRLTDLREHILQTKHNSLGFLTLLAELEKSHGTVEKLHRLLASVCYRGRYPTLSFMEFKVGDCVVFMPGKLPNERLVWVAFNSGCPYHYLAEESWTTFAKAGKNLKSIIGRLILIEHFVVPEGTNYLNQDYNLPAGTAYAVCQAIPLHKNSKSSSRLQGASASSSQNRL
jgi:hypothetical protein